MNRNRRFNVYDPNARLLSVMFLIGVGILCIVGRLFYLQIWDSSYLTDLARRQQERKITLKSQRGKIYDKRGRLFAVSVPVNSVYANPRRLISASQAARQLSPLLSIPYKELLSKLKSSDDFVWLKRQLNPILNSKIKELEIKGIGVLKEYRRYYPSGNFAGPLLGFTGIDSQGLAGLEYKYQRLLQGKQSFYIVEKDGTQRIIPSSEPEDFKLPHRYSLHLSVDSSLQFFAEKALQRGVEESKASGGIAIVMHPQTGAVQALAIYPGFDPNRYRDFNRSRYLNRAVTFGYEPGSVFKPLTVAAALESGVIKPDQVFYCENGEFQVADQVIHDTSPYGWLPLEQVIQKSSNICAGKIGSMLPPEKFHEYILKFGFGQKTGIGLPAEAIGRVLPANKWTEVDHFSISFGHGILVSPIQLITAINMIAAGGMLVPPYIVDYAENENGQILREIRDKGNKLIARFGPSPPKRVIAQNTVNIVKQFMVKVTHKGGTGVKAALKGYDVAGKTGTSQIFDEKTGRYSNKKHIALFAGFVPANSPEMTILVVIEHPKTSPYGGTVAAPVFQEIAKRSLLWLNVLPPPQHKKVISNDDSVPSE